MYHFKAAMCFRLKMKAVPRPVLFTGCCTGLPLESPALQPCHDMLMSLNLSTPPTLHTVPESLHQPTQRQTVDRQGEQAEYMPSRKCFYSVSEEAQPSSPAFTLTAGTSPGPLRSCNFQLAVWAESRRAERQGREQ